MHTASGIEVPQNIRQRQLISNGPANDLGPPGFVDLAHMFAVHIPYDDAACKESMMLGISLRPVILNLLAQWHPLIFMTRRKVRTRGFIEDAISLWMDDGRPCQIRRGDRSIARRTQDVESECLHRSRS